MKAIYKSHEVMLYLQLLEIHSSHIVVIGRYLGTRELKSHQQKDNGTRRKIRTKRMKIGDEESGDTSLGEYLAPLITILYCSTYSRTSLSIRHIQRYTDRAVRKGTESYYALQ
jgi:hypothetical protein